MHPVVCFGNSNTAGLGVRQEGGAMHELNWVELLRDRHGIPTIKEAVSGDGSSEIAVRQGGRGFEAVIEGGRIPAAGRVSLASWTISPSRFRATEVTFELPDGSSIDGLVGGTGMDRLGERTLHFQRAEPGAEIVVGTWGLRGRSRAALRYHDHPQILWPGEGPPLKAPETYLADTASMVAHLATPKRYMVVSPLDRGAKSRVGTEWGDAREHVVGLLKEAFGDHYLDIHGYLASEAMHDAEMEPTEADLADMDARTVPASLRSGGIHPNIIGCSLIAARMADEIRRRWPEYAECAVPAGSR